MQFICLQHTDHVGFLRYWNKGIWVGADKECMQNFDGEASMEMSNIEARSRSEENIKMNLWKRGFEGEKWSERV